MPFIFASCGDVPINLTSFQCNPQTLRPLSLLLSAMSYRVPTHLGTYVPPPAGVVNNTQDLRAPWKGSFVVSGLRPSDTASNVEIHVQGIDIDLGHW